MLQEDA